jgi:hypothetical protein
MSTNPSAQQADLRTEEFIIELPDGFKWHADFNGWCKEDLTDGWRPLLHLEGVELGDQVYIETGDAAEWVTYKYYGQPIRSWRIVRTQRPLPERKPLVAADMRPGVCLRSIANPAHVMILQSWKKGASLWSEIGWLSDQDLMDDYEINLHFTENWDPDEWGPCWRFAEYVAPDSK